MPFNDATKLGMILDALEAQAQAALKASDLQQLAKIVPLRDEIRQRREQVEFGFMIEKIAQVTSR